MVEIEDSVGSEQRGKRPAVVIQNNIGNKYSPTTIVALVTSKIKNNMPTHVNLHSRELPKKSTVMLEHIRTVSVKRLKSYICTVSNGDMKKIDTALKISLGYGKKG